MNSQHEQSQPMTRRNFVAASGLVVAGAAGMSAGLARAAQGQPASAQPKSQGKIKLKMGFHGERRHETNCRDTNFCGLAALIGTGRNERSHMHATHGVMATTPDTPKQIDPKKLAGELGVDVCMVNKGRIWTFDESYGRGGEVIDFHGVKMVWIGQMIGEDLRHQFSHPYDPSLIYRDTDWIYKAGREVFLLREPNGPVWVMQEYAKDVDPTLTIDNLKDLGGKFKKLPEGWKFEVKVLDKDLSLDTARSDLWASIIRDEFGCTYQACGYGADTSANYVP